MEFLKEKSASLFPNLNGKDRNRFKRIFFLSCDQSLSFCAASGFQLVLSDLCLIGQNPAEVLINEKIKVENKRIKV